MSRSPKMVPRDLDDSDEDGPDKIIPDSPIAQKQNLSEILRSDPPWGEQAKVSSPQPHVKPETQDGSGQNILPKLGRPLAIIPVEPTSGGPATAEDVFRSKSISTGRRNRPSGSAEGAPFRPSIGSVAEGNGHGIATNEAPKEALRRRSSAAELADFFKNTAPEGAPLVPYRKSDTAELADFFRNTPPPSRDGHRTSSSISSPSKPKPGRIRSMIAKVIHKGQDSQRTDHASVSQGSIRAQPAPGPSLPVAEDRPAENLDGPESSHQGPIAGATLGIGMARAETTKAISRAYRETPPSSQDVEAAVAGASARPSTLPQHQVLVFDTSSDSSSNVNDPAMVIFLRNILSPYYTVGSISGRALRKEPWEQTCALLVMLSTESTVSIDTDPLLRERISTYMRMGGKIWSIGRATALFCRSGMSLERKMIEDDLLFPGAMTVPVSRSLDRQEMPTGTSGATLVPDDDATQKGDLLVLKRAANNRIIALGWTPAQGKYAAWASDFTTIPGTDDTKSMTHLSSTLAFFGIQPLTAVNTSQSHWETMDPTLLKPTHPLPVFLLSHPKLPIDLPVRIVGSPEIDANSTEASFVLHDQQMTVRVLRDTEDTFNLIDIPLTGLEVPDYMQTQRTTETSEEDQNKRKAVPLLLGSHETWRPDWTPLFDFARYWSELDTVARKQGVMRKRTLSADPESLGSWSLGDVIQYGEAVGSTQTMLDR
jgi:hypothetical protein